MTVMDVARGELTLPRVQARSDTERVGERLRPAVGWAQAYRATLVTADAVVGIVVALVTAAVVGLTPAIAVLPVAWLVVAALCGVYRPNLLGAGAHDARAVLLAGVLLLAALPLAQSVGVVDDRSGRVVPAVVALTALAGVIRGVGRRMLKRRRRAGACTQRVLVVGDAQSVSGMVARLRRAADSLTAVGIAVPADQMGAVQHLGLPVFAVSDDDPESVLTMIGEDSADVVLLVPGPSVADATLRRVARACEWNDLSLLYSPAVVDVATSAPVLPVAGVPILSVPRPGPAGAGRLAKHAVDRIGAGVGLVLLLPLLLCVAIAVRLDSSGPVFFKQVRVGESGRTFRMIKFRTMRVDAEALMEQLRHLNESDGPIFKLKHDPRVTRVGGLLRSTSLDELPQLINVLLGQMSLVGPRPPLPVEVADYTEAERRRLLVKPGLTGLWQVGGRSNLSWIEAVRLDLRYVESWSLPLDIRILLRTIPAVLRRNGAY